MPTHELTPDESRILGVLVEKELTTPDQYPLTLHAAVAGANQKSNRHPVLAMTEDQARAAMVGLRAKGLAVQLDGHGSRTSKFRHEFASKVGLTKPEMVILAELLLRGPQTQGELRSRASRMHPLDSLDTVRNTLEQLMNRPEPLVQKLPPERGSRAERYAQLLCDELHAEDDEDDSARDADEDSESAPGAPTLAQRVESLESEVATLRAALKQLASQIGAEDPFIREVPEGT